jgi:hypothetical protein
MRIALKELRALVVEALEGDAYSKRDEMLDTYSDVYKEKYGIRPRWKFKEFETMTDAEIEAELNQLFDAPGDYDDEPSEEYSMEPQPHEPGYYPEPEGTVSPEELKGVHPMEDEPSKTGMKRTLKR